MPASDDQVRAFVAVELGAEAKAAAQATQQRLRQLFPHGGVRWAKPEQLHLTLRFLGDVSAERLPELTQALGHALAGVAPFTLHLHGCGVFPSPRAPRVLWLGLEGNLPALHDLRRRVSEAVVGFGDHAETHAFHPHLTLGRANRPDAAMARALQTFLADAAPRPPCPWEVGEVRLMRSQLRPSGAEHSELAGFSLAGARRAA